MDHQFQTRKVDAARGHIGGDTDIRPPVAQRGQRVCALLLAEFTRKGDDLKATVAHARHQMIDVHAGFTEHDGGLRFVKAQGVKDRMFAVAHGHRKRAVFDINVLFCFALGGNAQRIILEILRQFRDFFRHGGREHQRATLRRGRSKDIFQIVAEAQIQHLVGFVQHGSAQARQVQRFAVDMVAQTARCADHDMRAAIQRALFGAIVHAADAGCNLRACGAVKPLQLARHLQRQFTGGGNTQRQRHICIKQLVRACQNLVRHRDTKSNGLARSGLCRNQQIAALRLVCKHCHLHGSQFFIAFSGQSCGQRRSNSQVDHVFS